MKYLVVIEKARTGFSAYSPDLPGCVATGRTRRGVEKNMREAIELHLEGLRENGSRRPRPHSSFTYVEVSA
jgi:predicted RNase H-like HicB family nuclease